jgi:ribosomal protein S18 acetylase RimI-like enzyme
VTTIEPIDPFSHLDELVDIYADALGLARDDVAVLQWRDETLPRHAARDQFVFLGARKGDRVVGFAYGYRGDYGQWWTDRVAAAMDEPTRREWLDPPHYEVVELHVRPECQRRGLGTRLLEELLASQPNDRALLTADPSKPQPLPFYTKHGWRQVAEVRWTPESPPRLVLAKRL